MDGILKQAQENAVLTPLYGIHASGTTQEKHLQRARLRLTAAVSAANELLRFLGLRRLRH